MIVVQILKGSLIAWMLTLGVAALLDASHRDPWGKAVGNAAFIAGAFAFGAGVATLPGARKGLNIKRSGERGWHRLPDAGRDVSDEEFVGGLSRPLLAFIVALELFAYSWFFTPIG